MISDKQARKMCRIGIKRWLRSKGFVTHNGVSIGACEWAPPHYRTIRARMHRRPRMDRVVVTFGFFPDAGAGR